MAFFILYIFFCRLCTVSLFDFYRSRETSIFYEVVFFYRTNKIFDPQNGPCDPLVRVSTGRSETIGYLIFVTFLSIPEHCIQINIVIVIGAAQRRVHNNKGLV